MRGVLVIILILMIPILWINRSIQSEDYLCTATMPADRVGQSFEVGFSIPPDWVTETMSRIRGLASFTVPGSTHTVSIDGLMVTDREYSAVLDDPEVMVSLVFDRYLRTARIVADWKGANAGQQDVYEGQCDLAE
ncbi:MAG: hypothetical protein ACPGOY_02830 [Rhodospirillaceae bacterium]